MRVKIEEIQEEKGLTLEEAVDAKLMTGVLLDSPGFAHVGASKLKVTFQKLAGRVHLEGFLAETVKAPCKRCTNDVELTVPVEFNLRMISEAELAVDDDEGADDSHARRGRHHQRGEDDLGAPQSASFELEQIDAEPFDGKTIDLDPIVREQVLLALPVSVVCRDDCKGLCSTCGQDLNEGDCGHAGKKEVDVRLAKLKDIKLKS